MRVEEGDMTVCFTRDAHTLLEMCSHAGIAASSSSSGELAKDH